MNRKPCEYTSVIIFLRNNLQIKYSQDGDMTAQIGFVVEHRAMFKPVETKITTGNEACVTPSLGREVNKEEMELIAYEQMANQIFNEVIKQVREQAIAEAACLFSEVRSKLFDKMEEVLGKLDVETTKKLNGLIGK